MLSQEIFSAALAVEKAMYRALSEVEELTDELAQAVDRQDQVSVQMFLALRQEQIDCLTGYKAQLRRQCAGLPEEDGALLRCLLEKKEPPQCSGAEELLLQVNRNRALLERIVRIDQRISCRLGGTASFYKRKE